MKNSNLLRGSVILSAVLLAWCVAPWLIFVNVGAGIAVWASSVWFVSLAMFVRDREDWT